VHIDLDRLTHAFDFDVNTSVGVIRSGNFSLKARIGLAERFPGKVEVSSVDYVRAVISEIAGRPVVDSEEWTPLSKEELAGLTSEDLDEFARRFIEKNRSWLFESFTSSDGKEKQAREILETPQKPGEDIKEYLRRILADWGKRSAKRNRDLIGMSLSKRLFSSPAVDLLAKNSEIARALTGHVEVAKQLEALVRASGLPSTMDTAAAMKSLAEKLNLGEIAKREAEASRLLRDSLRESAPLEGFRPRPVKFELPRLPIPENPIHKTNKTLEVVASQISAVATVSSASAELLKNMNELALTMAKTSAEHADTLASQNRKMIRVGLIALGISTIGILASTVVSVAAYFQDKANGATSAVALGEVVRHLGQAHMESQQATDARFEAVTRQLRQAHIESQKGADARVAALEAQVKALTERRAREQQRLQTTK
jgi:hypothetical protein